MSLSNVEIQIALDAGRLVITPEPLPRRPAAGRVCPYNTHSVDLTLGPEITVPRCGPFSYDLALPGNLASFLTANSDHYTPQASVPFPLDPGRFILAMTGESIRLPIEHPVNRQTNTCLAARIEAKSSRARCGLLVHFTAPTVHPGFEGTLTLEMINWGPVPFLLRVGMPIAQLIVEEVKGIPFLNPSQFQGQAKPAGPPP
jgi:dCTP deaminase